MTARSGDWKTKPLPQESSSLHLDRTYSLEEFERVKAGTVPQSMDDKWFAYFESPWLYVHRSWTGVCVFHVRFAVSADDVRVTEVMVNRLLSQYGSKDETADVLLVGAVLDGLAGRENRQTWDMYFDRFSSGAGPD